MRDDDPSGGPRVGRIVEVEAYGGSDDRASHARFTSRTRNAVMAGPPGIAYVYLVYGMYDLFNVVTGPEGQPSAVLIRAVEPLAGLGAMRRDRLAATSRRRAARTPEGWAAAHRRIARTPDHRLGSGPGLVAAAFGLDTAWTGTDLCDPSSPIRLEPDPVAATAGPALTVASGPRIGVDYAGPEWAGRPWRWWIAGHRSVSGRASAAS